jgi:hypothetical protein
VALGNDGTGSTLFSASNMKPGDTSTHCITVSYTGSLAAAVKLYGSVSHTAGTPDLGPYIDLTVTQGSGGSFASCTGFTADASNATVFSGTLDGTSPFSATNWSNGLTTSFAPTASSQTTQSKTFQFTATLDANAPNTVQGGTASASFTWEAQNT